MMTQARLRSCRISKVGDTDPASEQHLLSLPSAIHFYQPRAPVSQELAF